MGCDGGTIPKRDELVKTKKKGEQKDKGAELAFRWQHCAVSQQPLKQPVVACELGRMYNKEAIIETLLEKSGSAEPCTSATTPAVADHVKSLRDVKTLNFTENPAWSEASTVEKGDGYIDMLKSRWICPIGGQEMNGRFRFVFIWTCGCVFSDRALKEMGKSKQETTSECLRCQKPFLMTDVILLNPAEGDEITLVQQKMEARRATAKDLKKAKKVRNKVETGVVASSSAKEEVDVELHGKLYSEFPSMNSSFNRVQGVEIQAKVLARKAKLEPTEARDSKIPKLTKLIDSYSVAQDPNASATYKSLFTSSNKAKEQQKAHWVTYNPFYN